MYKVKPRVFSLANNTGVLDIVYYPAEHNSVRSENLGNAPYIEEESDNKLSYAAILLLIVVVCILVGKFIL